MRYWLTTHWPPRLDDPNPAQHDGVWLQENSLEAAKGMEKGDLVLIYESGSGDRVKETYPDGSTKLIQRHPGKQGVVTLARILDKPSQPEDSRPEQYADGTQRWWRYKAPTEPLNSAGFIPRAELAVMLGYSPNYAFRGYGRAHSGLGELTKEQFAELERVFIDSTSNPDHAIAQSIRKGKWGGGGGEGPVHLALKTAIANDPEGMLGEPGLAHWATEFKLPTGDTIDVVLKDRFGRFVAVEVEVHCDQQEIIGPLQCMKYRAMLSYLFKRQSTEVRAMLVAHSIHDRVRRWSSDYKVECYACPSSV